MISEDKALLDFEGRYYRYAGAKEQAIRNEFGISATAYYQRIVWLLDDAEAQSYAPELMNRLRRIARRVA